MIVGKRRLLVAAKIAAAVGILGWLLWSRQLDPRHLESLRLSGALYALIALRILAALLPVLRWQIVLRSQGIDFPMWPAVHIGLIGTFFNSVTPSTLGQDATRLILGRKIKPGVDPVLMCSIAADRFIGLSALAMVGMVVGIGDQFLSSKPMSPVFAFAPLALLAALLVGGGMVLGGLRVSGLVIGERIRAAADSVLRALDGASHRPQYVWLALLLSIGGHAAVMGSYYAAFLCLHVKPPALVVFCLAPVVILLRATPVIPMGLGVTEWGAELVYAQAGLLDGAEVVALTRVVSIIFGLLCGTLLYIPIRQEGAHATV